LIVSQKNSCAIWSADWKEMPAGITPDFRQTMSSLEPDLKAYEGPV
jgi:hypothetical protein